MSFRSEQEKAIYDLSKVVLGAQALFNPDNYKNGTKEPADLVWVSGRCAVLMYMTSGKRSFDQKRKHNLAQLQTWLRHWSQGHNLTGTIDGQRVEYAFDDIDHVLGLSIIGGADIGCIYEDDNVAYASGKLAGCVTITDGIFEKLARRFVSIRDIVFLALAIRGMDGRADEADVAAFLDHWAATISAQLRQEFEVDGPDFSGLEVAWRDVRAFMLALKSQADLADIGPMVADFNFGDVVWLSVAEGSLISQIAKPGEFGCVALAVKRTSGIYQMLCFVSAGNDHGTDKAIEEMKSSNFSLMTRLDFGPSAPIRILGVRDPGGQRMLVRELLELKALSISAS